MKHPLVSVVMITYGHEKYIKHAIESVLMQQCNFDFELIIANDCSPDSTDIIIKELLAKHEKANLVNYTVHEKNIGLMSNFIWAMQQSKGKYIAICEGDDYWTDELKLQKQCDFLASNDNAVFSFHGAKTIDNNLNFGTYIKSPLFRDKAIVPKKEFISKGGGYFCTASIMFRATMIFDMPPYFANCFSGDFPLALLAISNGEIGYLAEEMAVYRVMAENSWSAVTDKDMIFKEKKFENTMMTLRDFDAFTNHKYHPLLDNLKSLCSYQLLHSYFSVIKSKRVRFSKYIEFGKNLNVAHRTKILIKLAVK